MLDEAQGIRRSDVVRDRGSASDGCSLFPNAELTSSVFWRLGRGVVTPTKPFAMHTLVYVTVAPNGLDLGVRD